MRRLRAQALPAARLIVVGSQVDRDYSARLRSLAAREGGWIEFREDLSREGTNRLIGECRYGVQAMIGEHFGMATAEMARGGCLVFAHDSGGTPEVIGDPALLWNTEDEAVARITMLATDASRREAARSRLRARARSFTTGRFCEELRQLAEHWIAK